MDSSSFVEKSQVVMNPSLSIHSPLLELEVLDLS